MAERAGVNRRDFLRLRAGAARTATLSCEQLYMNYVNACVHGTTAGFLVSLEGDLDGVARLQLTQPEWLSRRELRDALEPVLERFRQRGGIVTREG